MVHSFAINELPVKTGDLICTADGGGPIVPGEFWRLVGKLIPGDVDYIVIYVGPAGRCIEAGAKGVISFETNSSVWDATAMFNQRQLIDQFYGISYPLARRNLLPEQEESLSEKIVAFCLPQVGKPWISFAEAAAQDC